MRKKALNQGKAGRGMTSLWNTFLTDGPRGFAHIQLKDNNICQINNICTQSFIQLDCNNVRSYWTDSFVVLKPLSDQPHVMSSEANSDIMQRWEQPHLHYIPPLIRRWGSLDLMDRWRLQSELCLNINIRPNPSCKHTWGSKRNMNLSVYLSIYHLSLDYNTLTGGLVYSCVHFIWTIWKMFYIRV